MYLSAVGVSGPTPEIVAHMQKVIARDGREKAKANARARILRNEREIAIRESQIASARMQGAIVRANSPGMLKIAQMKANVAYLRTFL